METVLITYTCQDVLSLGYTGLHIQGSLDNSNSTWTHTLLYKLELERDTHYFITRTGKGYTLLYKLELERDTHYFINSNGKGTHITL